MTLAVRQDPHPNSAVVVGQQGTALLIGLNERGIGVTDFLQEPADRHLVQLVTVDGLHEIPSYVRPHDLKQASPDRR